MPQSVTELEETIVEVAGAAKWLWGNSETVPSLAREGWDFKSSEASGLLAYSPLQVLRDLLAAGVAPDRPDDSGRTALYRVAEQDDVEGLRMLLSYGADPNVVADDGDTILMAAARAGVSENVAELLKYHLAVNARNKKRESAIEAAVAGYLAVRFRLGPAEEKRADVVRLLAQAGADLNVQDENGNSPLHTVSRMWPSDNNINVLHALIENGAALNVRNQEGDTPLMTASSPEMAQILVDAGADILIRNSDGLNALEKAKALASGPKLGPEAENSHAKIAVLESAAQAQNKDPIAAPH
jgi:ankyrin repeat protein